MRTTGRWRAVALLAIGVSVGSVLGPPLAKAATNLVTIKGAGSANEAKVNAAGRLLVDPGASITKAGQVATAIADPSQAVVVVSAEEPPLCDPNGVYRVPVGKALMITSVEFLTSTFHAGTSHDMSLRAGPAGTPCATIIAAVLVGPETSSQNQVFQPGIPVPAGDAIGLDGANEAGTVAFYGYLVPASAVPANALSSLPSASGRTSVLPVAPNR